MYENNIKNHFVEYVNVVWKKKFIVRKIRKLNITKKEKNAKINKLCNQLRKIKNNLLNVKTTQYKSHISYHPLINQ
jgi:predicted transcriptional regulator